MARGRLTLLSAAERRYCDPLLRGFTERFPEIEVEFVFGISTALTERFLEQHGAGGPTADLVWSSAMDQQMQLVLDGHAQPHGVPHDLPLSAAYRDLALATTCEPLFTLSRDPSAPAGTPAELAALIAADPARYRGRVAIPDIETNGLGFLAMLRWSLDAPCFDPFLATLATAAPRVCGSAPALVSSLAEGCVLGLHVLGAYALRAVAADPELHIAPSAEPASGVARIAFIPRRAANPAAAAAFLAYLVSPEGQAALGEAGLFPILAAQPHPVSPIPIADGLVHLLAPAHRSDLLARWRSALGRQ